MTTRCALLVNPASGKGRHADTAAAVRDRLTRRGGFDVTVMQGADADEARELARSAVEDGHDIVAAMGGDKTVHLTVQALAYSSTRLGIIATGTGNDVARYFGLPRGRPLEVADVIADGSTRRIDLGHTGATYFTTVLATGFDSLVNERANAMTWPRGQIRYTLATLGELRVFDPISYTVELDGERRGLDAMLVAVGNGPSYGGGLRICEGAELDDGQLDVVVISPISKLELLKVYPRLFRGTHVTHPAYQHFRVRTVSVAARGIVAYADGERIGPLPMTVEPAAGALGVCVPKGASW
ncbi:MAG: diacylglycerol/lipid kinase family protein [Nocardioidaceae bacterium]